MTAEDIFNTCGAHKDAAWLRAIRALSDADFERLVQMQEEEERWHEECWGALSGIMAAPEEAAQTSQVIPFPVKASRRVAEWEVHVDRAGESWLVNVFRDGRSIRSVGFISYEEAAAAAYVVHDLHGFDIYRPAFPHGFEDCGEVPF